TLTPGGVIVVAGTTVSLSPRATVVVVNGVTQTLFPATTTLTRTAVRMTADGAIETDYVSESGGARASGVTGEDGVGASGSPGLQSAAAATMGKNDSRVIGLFFALMVGLVGVFLL
ncbi:hypothetical protein LTS18_006602, partial [Coniosporium uncinatum]